MATEEQLKQALIKAHNSGDTEAANLFASRIKSMRQGVETKPPAKQPVVKEPSFSEQMLGGLENVAAFASSALAEPLAGLSGIAADVIPGGKTGVEQIESTRRSLTYQPRTDAARSQQESISQAIAPVAEKFGQAERFLGEETLKLTGSPALASFAHTLPTAALELLGVKGARRATAVKKPTERLIEKTIVESAPEINQVKKASRAIFDELDNSGVSIKHSSLKRLERNLDNIAKKEGIDSRVTPEAAGAIEAVRDSISKGNAIPTSEMDTLRTIAKNSIVGTDANKMRVGSAIVDEIDSFLDDIKSKDIERGASINASEVGKKYRDARKLWGRAKRAEMLQDAIEMGASRKAGVEKGIRNELNNLLNRKKSRKFLSKEDVEAIRKVTDGDFKQNIASLIGGMGLKFENSPGLFGSILSGGGVGAIASTIPGLGGAVAPVAVGAITLGTISKEVAKKITTNRARFLKSMATSGNDAKRITTAYLRAVPKNKRSVADLSDLLLDPNIDLDALDNLSNEIVKDAIKAAQFKRELLQAGAALGVSGNLTQDNINNEETK